MGTFKCEDNKRSQLTSFFPRFVPLAMKRIRLSVSALMACNGTDGSKGHFLILVTGQLGVAAVGSAYVWLEPLTIKMVKGEDGVQVTATQMSWLVAIVEIGCALSTIPAGYLADWYGRKLVSLLIGPLCLVSWATIVFTRSVELLYMVRLLQGVATGIAFTINPIYTAEIVEPSRRGAVSGIFQVAWFGGVFYSFSTGPFLGYEWYAASCMPLPLLYTAAMYFFPESPYWLLKRGYEKEAKKSLAWFRSDKDIDGELRSMQLAVADQMNTGSKNPLKVLFLDRYERKAFLVLQVVSFAKFLTGMPTIISYSTETFSKSNNFISPSVMTIILGILLTAIGAVSAVLSDKVGRKSLLLVSCFGCFVAHFFTGLYYFLVENTDVDTKPLVWMMYLGIVGYCFFSNIGLGPLLQTLQAELFGAQTREMAGGITESFASVLCFIIIRIYQPINESIGVYFNFWFYGMVGLVTGLLLHVYMYETAGRPIGGKEGRKEKPLDNSISVISSGPL